MSDENREDKKNQSLESFFQKLGVSSEEEALKMFQKIKEDNQILQENNQILQENNQKEKLRADKNEVLVQYLNNIKSNNSSIDSLTRSKFYDKMVEVGLIDQGFKIEDWNLGDTQEDEKIKSFCEKYIEKNNYSTEHSFHKALKELTINSVRLELYDSSKTNVLDGKSDWVVKTKRCPLDPHHIHIVGDTKIIKSNKGTPDSTMIGQIMHYLKKLTNNQKKSYMFGFIIAPKGMLFIKYIVKSSQFQISDFIPIEKGLKLLKRLILIYTNYNHLIPTSLLDRLSINEKSNFKYIGGGASANVFVLNSKRVFKQYLDGSKNDEVATIRQLKSQKINGVVQLKDDCIDEDYIEISPYGEVLNIDHVVDVYIKALSIIKAFHDIGIIHRDIRSSNIIIYNNEPIFIDWGYSTKVGVISYYYGSLSTASDRILPFIDNNIKFSVSKSDELESFVKTFILTKFPFIAKVIRSAGREPLTLHHNWSLIWDLLEKFPVFKNLLEYAKQEDYSKMGEILKTIDIRKINIFLTQFQNQSTRIEPTIIEEEEGQENVKEEVKDGVDDKVDDDDDDDDDDDE